MSKVSSPQDFKAALQATGFTGELVVPGDPDYEPSLVRFSKCAQRNAGLVAFVKSADDVSKVLKFVNTHSSAHDTQIPVVIRGGGHSTSGASSTDGGIVIDLSRHLNSVRVDEEDKLGYVGGGATWADVDNEAIKHGLAVTGGTVNHTGVGGLSLGGGYGWLVGEHGMTIDNIVQVTLVTADGSIRTLNESSHADLFWAIRGGGCNFGCVTEFVYRLHPQRSHIFAGPLVFSPALLPAVVGTMEEWYATAGEKDAAFMAMTNKTPTGQPGIVVIVFYNGDEDEGKERFAKLISLGPMVNGAGMIPYEVMNTLQNPMLPYGASYHFTSTVRGNKAVEPQAAQNMFNRMMELANSPKGCATSSPPMVLILWEYLNLKKAASVPADATAFRMRLEYPSLPLLIHWEGDSAEATKDAKERLRQLKRVVEENVKGTFPPENEDSSTGYGNYEPTDSQSMDTAAPLYGRNYPRLQQLKRRYDPDMLFRSWYPIQPAKEPQSADASGARVQAKARL